MLKQYARSCSWHVKRFTVVLLTYCLVPTWHKTRCCAPFCRGENTANVVGYHPSSKNIVDTG
ncbi:hypothetical protein PR003_g29704 [Phytophthora rubi]|uniref:Secreted protein n=1 Tax=Phytophthora rubi TaxID=129364 RepID=A0A6A3GWW4_9STRA|nr:hypothetical protein PR001_g30024 [Phytophthora rubi]KAE8967795.1 hypothetical protein PR002_g27949 [Phytophthora rubi]KAE9274126.1 hypothetical protein PR003_g29704 [Phytophthora rubi]